MDNVSKRHLKTASVAYLYGSDLHLVIVHERRDPKAGKVQWVSMHERVFKTGKFDGRIVIHDTGILYAMLLAESVRPTVPAIHGNGSEATKAQGISVGSLTICYPDYRHLYLHDMPGLLGGGYTYDSYQAEQTGTFDNADLFARWADYNVGEVVRAKGSKVTT